MIPYCILAIENDDDRAFMEGLVRDYYRLIYRAILDIIKDPWAVEDVYQTTWEKLIDKLQLLRSRNRAQRVNYMISTAKNLARNYIRDNPRRRETEFADGSGGAEEELDEWHFDLRLIRDEELECLDRIWPQLDERSRQLLEGYYILEKPMSELAEEIGIKAASVRMALTRARKQALFLLQNELEKPRELPVE